MGYMFFYSMPTLIGLLLFAILTFTVNQMRCYSACRSLKDVSRGSYLGPNDSEATMPWIFAADNQLRYSKRKYWEFRSEFAEPWFIDRLICTVMVWIDLFYLTLLSKACTAVYCRVDIQTPRLFVEPSLQCCQLLLICDPKWLPIAAPVVVLPIRWLQ